MAKTSAPNREELIGELGQHHLSVNELIRFLVLKGGRVDVLCREVLGYQVAPGVHEKIINWQNTQRKTMVLAYRGCGKTTTTIGKVICAILRNPDVAILYPSKTQAQANDILHEIKGHFETNERLHEIFGTGWIGDYKWTESQIVVGRRRTIRKEPTVMAVGVGGAVPSKHVEMIIGDDLVDETNARTQYQRDVIEDWYYKVLEPCLNPYQPDVLGSGEMHLLGTVYHWDDLYARLRAKGWEQRLLRIPAIGEDGETVPWPERHTLEWFLEKRREYGRARFDSQFQCTATAMKGKIFRWEDIHFADAPWEEEQGNVYMGVDPAIGQDSTADHFAITIIGVIPEEKAKAQDDAKLVEVTRSAIGGKSLEEMRSELASPNSSVRLVRRETARKQARRFAPRVRVRVLDAYHGRHVFRAQTDKIIEMADKWGVTRIGVETNGYQLAQYQELIRRRPDLSVVPIPTTKGKVARAWDLASRFEAGMITFQPKPNNEVQELIDQLIEFPDSRRDDLFDSLDHAVTAAERRGRKARSKPLGLL